MKCKYCGKEYSKFGIDNHIAIMHLKSRKPAVFYRATVWNKGLTKETDAKVLEYSQSISKTVKGKPRHQLSAETKGKLSSIRSKIIEEMGVGGFKNIKWYKVKNINGDEFILRGTWEVKVANWLNLRNILWVRKKYLKYKNTDGVNRTYCPDFYLSEFNIYIEVKGYFSQLDKNKIKLVKEQNNIKLLLLFAKHIKKLIAGDSNIGMRTGLISLEQLVQFQPPVQTT